jgi:uncharacterized protein (DUF58 family)
VRSSLDLRVRRGGDEMPASHGNAERDPTLRPLAHRIPHVTAPIDATPLLDRSGLVLPPELRARLSDIEIRSRRLTRAGRLGQQASRSRGPGIEFAQYRSYEPGDDPRSIDWKLHARSDRWFVREAERESPLTLWLLFDATASMAQADAARPAWSRLHAARRIAACAIEIALRQGDSFGIAVIGGAAFDCLPPAAGLRQRDQCLRVLATTEADGAWPDERRLRPLWERIHDGAQVVLLSDMFDDAAVALAERLAGAGRDIATVQVLTAEERDFPFIGTNRFVDPESGAEWVCDAADARPGFIERFAAARRALAARLAARGIAHVEHVIDQSEDVPLRALFGRPGTARAR